MALIIGVSALAVVVGGLVGVTARILWAPDEAVERVTSSEDAARARQKLLAVGRGRSRGQAVTLSEAEVNALLSRHVMEARGTRLEDLGVRLLGGDRIQLQARTPLGGALDEVGLGELARRLPLGWQGRPLLVRVGAQLTVDGDRPRQLQVKVDELRVGRQRLPAPTLRLLLDPAAVGLLRWRLPEHVEAVAVEPGRVVIQTAP